MEDIVRFKDVGREDVNIVGGKGANLGELSKFNMPVPDGFIVTSGAYFKNLIHSGAQDRIRSILHGLDVNNPLTLEQKALECQNEIKNIQLDPQLENDLYKFYEKLSGKHVKLVAVRSSATAEDLQEASFAGQQSTFLNIKGNKNLKHALLNAWASLFEARAIFYRNEQHFDNFKVGIAIPVQIMVQSETSGIMFTLDPVTNDKNKIIIEAVFGLGELIVGGKITPDHYEIDKKTFKIISKKIANQDKQLVNSPNGNELVTIAKSYQETQKLTDEKIIELAKIGNIIEKHYFFPQDIEWALEKNNLYIVQTRPITTIKKADHELPNLSNKGLAKVKITDGALPGTAGLNQINKTQKTLDYRPSEEKIHKTATQIYVNLAEPQKSAQIAAKNVDGVGLLSSEFILAQIGKHPKQFIAEKKQQEFINKLSNGLSTVGRSFGKRPVFYKATDLNSNEYRHLSSGDKFEPKEPNAMLGYRGAYRIIKDPDVFKLELEALKLTRQKHRNVHLMIPFVRNVQELIDVKNMVTASGLFTDSSFKFFMMVEIPSNVILLEDFIKVGIDGISIGTDNLTMLILGTDRHNEEVAVEFRETDPAVRWALEHIVRTAVKRKIKVSICDHASSAYPELTQMLVSWGISAISVDPESIEQTRQNVYEAEHKLLKKS